MDGAGNTIADPAVTGDGRTTAQTLTWSLADATADIDVAEGSVVTVTYDVVVLDNVLPGQKLTNSATARWTGLDGASTFERTGSGTPAVNDYFTAPATTSLTAALAVSVEKSVVNATTGEDPGGERQPRRHASLHPRSHQQEHRAPEQRHLDGRAGCAVRSRQPAGLSAFRPGADTAATNPAGGTNGTGIVDIRSLALAAQGDPGDSLTVVFEATLAPVIQSGTAVLNRAQLTGDDLASATSNETSTLITSAPAFEVWKTSRDLTGDPSVLMAGDTLRYTLTVKNIGNENAVNTVLRDPDSRQHHLCGRQHDPERQPRGRSGGRRLAPAGRLAGPCPEDATAGAMRADATATAGNVATVTFDVVINRDVVDGAVISNQGFVTADGAGSGPAPEEPSDDPATRDP